MKIRNIRAFIPALLALQLTIGSAGAQVVAGFEQRYQAANYDMTNNVWPDSSENNIDATADGAFSLTTTPNGATAVANRADDPGQFMDFDRGAGLGQLGGSGFTVQIVMSIDADGNDDVRKSPIGFNEASGWSGLFMSARANDTVRLRAGNQGGTGRGTSLRGEDVDMTVDADVWGVYTLVVDTSANPPATWKFNRLSDAQELWSFTDDNGFTEEIIGIDTVGKLFAGEQQNANVIGLSGDWRGAIADVVVYNTTLSSGQLDQNIAEFQALYSSDLAPFLITSIVRNPDGTSVTLTWTSSETESYIARYSSDLSNWESDLDDGLTMADDDENPDDGNLFTHTFTLSSELQLLDDLFIRIEEEVEEAP